MSTTNIVPPTVEEIYEHVRALPATEIVGVCGMAYHCLIAEHLRPRYPGFEFSVQLGSEIIEYVPTGTPWPRFLEDRRFVSLPNSDPLWRMARGFDQLADSQTKITAHDATIYLHGFLRATREGWV